MDVLDKLQPRRGNTSTSYLTQYDASRIGSKELTVFLLSLLLLNSCCRKLANRGTGHGELPRDLHSDADAVVDVVGPSE